MNFYISDLHLGHKKALQFDNRPFDSLEEEEKVIVYNWNDVVRDWDHVYILGDMFWSNNKGEDILKQLKGFKHLIRGNHDRLNAEMKKLFVDIKDYAEIKDDGRDVVLSHYPIAHWRNADYGTYHLYGHIHNGRDTRPFNEYVKHMKSLGRPYECYNVGCMLPYMDYTPRTLNYIIVANK